MPSVEIDEETNDRLEQLQAEIERETGRKVTKQELVARLIDLAFESKDEFIERYNDS